MYTMINWVLMGWVLLTQPVIVWTGEPKTDSGDEAIYRWVAAEMGAEPIWPMPVIRRVDHDTLETRFAAINRRVYPLLSAKYGANQAKAIMTRYMDELAGLYDPHTETVYLGNFLGQCRQKAVLAHEICHFFQFRQAGPKSQPAVSAELEQLTRELEAQCIERKFMELHCPVDSNSP